SNGSVVCVSGRLRLLESSPGEADPAPSEADLMGGPHLSVAASRVGLRAGGHRDAGVVAAGARGGGDQGGVGRREREDAAVAVVAGGSRSGEGEVVERDFEL